MTTSYCGKKLQNLFFPIMLLHKIQHRQNACLHIIFLQRTVYGTHVTPPCTLGHCFILFVILQAMVRTLSSDKINAKATHTDWRSLLLPIKIRQNSYLVTVKKRKWLQCFASKMCHSPVYCACFPQSTSTPSLPVLTCQSHTHSAPLICNLFVLSHSLYLARPSPPTLTCFPFE